MICSVLTVIFSPSRMLLLRLRSPPGLLHTRSRNSQAQARRWRRRKSSWLLKIQWWRNPLPRKSNLLLPMTQTHRAPPLTAPRRRRPRMTGHFTSPGCLSPWMRPQKGKPIPYDYRLTVILTENLDRSWTCSRQSILPTSRKYPPGRGTNPRRRLDCSLVLGSRPRNPLETRA